MKKFKNRPRYVIVDIEMYATSHYTFLIKLQLEGSGEGYSEYIGDVLCTYPIEMFKAWCKENCIAEPTKKITDPINYFVEKTFNCGLIPAIIHRENHMRAFMDGLECE